MPFRKRKTTTKKRRVFRRRGARRKAPGVSRSVIRNISMSSIPDRLYTRMGYSMSTTLTSTLSPAYNIFRLNSLYDPDYTGAGGQPLARDQWANFYNRYLVYGVSYKVTFINTSTSEQVYCWVVPKNVTAVSTSAQVLFEKPYAKNRILGVESGKSIGTIKGYASAAKALGYTKQQYQSEKANSSEFNSNPASEGFLHVYSQAADETTSVTVRIRVVLTYYVCLSERLSLAPS